MIRYWNFTDIAKHTGLSAGSLRQRQFRGTFPAPDAEIGSAPGWLPDTITAWWAGKSSDEKAAAELLTTNAAAARMGVSPRTLQSWRGSGLGPAPVKLGSLVRYKTEDVDAWIEGGQGA